MLMSLKDPHRMNLWGSVLLRLDTMYKFRIYTNLEQSIPYAFFSAIAACAAARRAIGTRNGEQDT